MVRVENDKIGDNRSLSVCVCGDRLQVYAVPSKFILVQNQGHDRRDCHYHCHYYHHHCVSLILKYVRHTIEGRKSNGSYSFERQLGGGGRSGRKGKEARLQG